MRVIAGLIADHAHHDQESGRVHLEGGGVAGIAVESLPSTHRALGLLLALQLNKDEPPCTLSIDLHTPDGRHRPLAEVHMDSQQARHSEVRWAAIDLRDLLFDQYGGHRIEISGEQIDAFALPLEVRQISALADGAPLQ